MSYTKDKGYILLLTTGNSETGKEHIMRSCKMQTILENYRESCNMVTERIEELNKLLQKPVPPDVYKSIDDRRRILREERLELLRSMQSLQGYCQ